VAKLSNGWGTSHGDVGTTVWAQVPISRGAPQMTPAGVSVVAESG
jgi:hypothetical protein